MSINADTIETIFPEISEIQDERLRQAVVSIWLEACNDGKVEDLKKIPKNLENIGYTLVNHTRVVTRLCMETARTVKELHNIEVNTDLLLAAALLHDVSKVMEINVEGENFKVSEFGKKIQHGFYSAYKAYEKQLPLELQHMIITHTPKSRVMPQSIEAVILHYIDFADTDILNQSLGIPLMLKR